MRGDRPPGRDIPSCLLLPFAGPPSRSSRCGLPCPSTERRLKTMLPGGCSAAWRYHRGKWSRVNMLASSAGVRNCLQGESSSTSPRSRRSFFPLFVHTMSSWLGPGSGSPLLWWSCRKKRLAPKLLFPQTMFPVVPAFSRIKCWGI